VVRTKEEVESLLRAETVESLLRAETVESLLRAETFHTKQVIVLAEVY